MGAAIVAGVDAPPALELAEHVLDVVAPPIECGISVLRFVFDKMHAVVPRAASAWWNQSPS